MALKFSDLTDEELALLANEAASPVGDTEDLESIISSVEERRGNNEADGGGGGVFGGDSTDLSFPSVGNIFTVPTGGLLGASTSIGQDPSGSFLSGAVPTFSVPSTPGLTLADIGLFQPSGSMMGNTFLASPSGLGPSGIDFSNVMKTDLTGGGTPDMTGVTVTGTPFQNVSIGTGTSPVSTSDAGVITMGPTSGAVQLPTMTVTGSTVPNLTFTGGQTPSQVMGPGLLGDVNLGSALGGAVQLDPFYVSANKPADLPTVTYTGSTPSSTGSTTAGMDTGVTTLPAMTVTGERSKTPTATTPQIMDLMNQATKNWGNQPIQLPPVTATTTGSVTPEPVSITPTTLTPPPLNVTVPPQVTVPPTTTTPPLTPVIPSGATPSGGGTATATTPTSTTSSAMTERDLAKELEKTMAAFNQFRPGIQQMYGELYQQFMPKGISQTESGLIDQYQRDLARLQQRQAGMLSPEDVRQSQQAAREAYGARGQTMGRGAIGAEILNREAVRQAREDQARAAMQQSYGNILNMSNLQTGNIFSPIASLMSNTFNPLGAYPADVYGTNVNAQLARDIAQKNYEAAVKAAELSGAAQKSAATTSLGGDVLGAVLPNILKSIPFICWVAREVYGEENPKWMQFRDWLFRHAPSWFFNLYLEHGEKVAAWLKRHPWAKRPIRIWMDSRIRSMEKRKLVLKEAV